MPDYISQNLVTIVAIVALGIAAVAWSGAGGRMLGCLKQLLPGNGLGSLHAGHYLNLPGILEYGPAIGTPATQYPPAQQGGNLVIVPPGYHVHQHQAAPLPVPVYNPPPAHHAGVPAAVPAPQVLQAGAGGPVRVVVPNVAPPAGATWILFINPDGGYGPGLNLAQGSTYTVVPLPAPGTVLRCYFQGGPETVHLVQ